MPNNDQTPPAPIRRRRNSVSCFFIKPRLMWRVRWRNPENNKFTTRHLKDKDAALRLVKQLQLEEQRWGEGAISPAERIFIEQLRATLFQSKRPFEEASGEMLKVAARKSCASITLEDSIEAFLTNREKRKLRPASLSSYRQCLNKFKNDSGAKNLSEITKEVILNFIIKSHSVEASRKHNRSHLLAWWNWSASKGWCSKDEVKNLKWEANIQDEKEIPSFSAQESRDLLSAMPDEYKAVTAIGLFAGIRPQELLRIHWNYVNVESRIIVVPSHAAKNRKKRILDKLEDNIWKWISAYPPPDKDTNLIPIKMHLWQGLLKRVKKMANLPPRGHDIIRKTFASMGFHTYGPQRASELMGHLNGLDVYYKHYRAIRSASEAKEYFSIVPLDPKLKNTQKTP